MCKMFTIEENPNLSPFILVSEYMIYLLQHDFDGAV